jgi:signal-transduction protein with cAMP-binding, CBS, and nucleotidyltransferase domain
MKIAHDIVRQKGGGIISVSRDTTVREALMLMNQKGVGSVVVTLEGRPIGIWTSRNLMHNVLMKGFDPTAAKVGDLMVSRLKTAPYTDDAYNLMDKFLGLRVNHLLIEKEGKTIGLLSSGDVMKAVIQEKTEELETLNRMVSWEYYEEWRWKPSEKK